MPESLRTLYESRTYPAMSHPLADPAVSAVAAMLAGLEIGQPSRARILEIGCASGHNLIPLAMRWPDARVVGMDLSVSATRLAGELAAAAGVTNVEFFAADLRDFEPDGGGFDFIIAHGFFSWVPDEVKAALFAFCRRHLAPQGIATVSFNVEAGWLPRFPVIQKVRAILQAGAADEMTALAVLRSVTAADSPELAIIDDMMAKGAGILPFDDFAPVNDPWPLARFVHAAAASGLRWLGESAPGENFPGGLDSRVIERLRTEAADSLRFHDALDRAAGRTFRSAVLCRDDAPVTGRISLKQLLEIAVGCPRGRAGGGEQQVIETIASFAPACVPVAEVVAAMPGCDAADVARRVWEGIQQGWILPRIEPVRFDADPADFPRLNSFRLECAKRRLPLVDVWHRPCSFPARHYEVLAAMDGALDRAGLAALARARCPELAFEPWLRHLAERGMFA